jgi:hypothetical protein
MPWPATAARTESELAVLRCRYRRNPVASRAGGGSS